MLETNIRNYISHLGDSEYMAEIVTSPNAVDTLIKLIQIHDGDTCLFIRDFVIACSRNDICKQVWENELELAIIPELEKLLFVDNHFIRRTIIYTLGKICSYSSIPIMLNLFSQVRDKDPIILPLLVGELFWLGVDNGWQIVESMTTSNNYITRWSVMETLGRFIYSSHEDETFLIRYKFCQQLRSDIHLLVRTEAEYEYQFLEFNRQKHQDMSKSDYKKQTKALKKQLEPHLYFSNVAIQFSNSLYQQNLYTYSIQELENFINQLLKPSY
jgi:hypothetical protein